MDTTDERQETAQGECGRCGRTFEKRTQWSSHCPECAEWVRTHRPCRRCKEEFEVRDEADPDGRTYCVGCAQEVEREWRKGRVESRRRHLSESLSVRQRTYSFDTFPASTPSQKAAMAAMRAEPGRSRWLYGPVGAGKTGLAVSVAKLLIEECDVLFIQAGAMFDELRDAECSDDPRDRGEAMQRFACADALVLDDIDKERFTEFAIDRFFRVIDSRFEDERVTIVTTNRKPSEFAEVVGQAVVSRLSGMSEVLELKGPDMRVAAKAGGRKEAGRGA